MSNRIFYASQSVAVFVPPTTYSSSTVVQGATSVSLATNFSLDKMYQLGHISVYDQVVNAPEVEVTIAKNLDGNPSIYHLATGGGSLVATSASAPTLVLAIGSDTDTQVIAANAPTVVMTGCFLKSVKYDMQVEGAFTEECSFVGSSKTASTAGVAPATSGAKVLTRRNFVIGGSSALPSEVSGKNLQSVSISADLGREAMYKLGQFTPFFRAVQFPLEITCEIAVLATESDGVLLDASAMNGCVPSGVPTQQPIKIQVCAATGAGAVYYTFDLGDKNTLQSVNYSGGDTGGGNVTITYSYTTANTLTITG